MSDGGSVVVAVVVVVVAVYMYTRQIQHETISDYFLHIWFSVPLETNTLLDLLGERVAHWHYICIQGGYKGREMMCKSR